MNDGDTIEAHTDLAPDEDEGELRYCQSGRKQRDDMATPNQRASYGGSEVVVRGSSYSRSCEAVQYKVSRTVVHLEYSAVGRRDPVDAPGGN